MSGTRTRTGCLTCRKRRVKCDESKPSCSRCLNANVVCDGYPDKKRISPPSNSSPQHQTRKSLGTLSTTNERGLSDSHDRLALATATVTSSPVSFPSPNSRFDYLSAYHHFVTFSVHQVFRTDQIGFWRDEVARMSWTVDVVYQAISAVGAMEKANLLPPTAKADIEGRRARAFGYQAYHNATHLLAEELRHGIGGREELLTVVLVLLILFECSVGNAHVACQHLWAAIQLLKGSFDTESSNKIHLAKLRETVMRLDFLAQSIMPYGRSSFFRAFAFKAPLMEKPFYSDPGLDLDYLVSLGCRQPPDAVSLQHLSLLRLISAHNHIDRIVWSSFYGQRELPNLNELLSFHAELLQWRATSHETFEFYEDFAVPFTSPTLDELPIPPEPMHLPKSSIAVTIAYYNCYKACTLSMLALPEQGQSSRDAHELEAFTLTYQNLRLAAGMLAESETSQVIGAAPLTKTANCAIQLDPNITIPLFLGARRCFKQQWYEWTIFALRHLGRSGLCDGRALANCLQILNDRIPRPVTDTALSPLGRLNERTVPLLMPTSTDDGMREAFYLRQNRGDGLLVVVAKATWRQREQGLPTELSVERIGWEGEGNPGSMPRKSGTEVRDPLHEWKQSLEEGWHTFINQPQF